MKITHRIAISALSCISFAAIAQQTQEQRTSPFQTPAAQPPGVSASQSASTTTTATIDSPLLLNLSGLTVTDQSGQAIGPLQHILLTPSGCVDLAVLSLGGQKLVPVPWQMVAGGTGVARGETAVGGRATLSLNVDRAKLQQAPSFTVNQLTQLTQQQTIQQQVYNYFGQQPRHETGTGGTSSQTDVKAGGSASATNRVGADVGTTNQTGILPSTGATNLSPTGATNNRTGQPGLGTNRPGQPTITPGRPENRPPFNRPPTNRPPSTVPGQPTPGSSGTPGSGQQP